MTVAELIEELKKYPDYLDVEISVKEVTRSILEIKEDNQSGVHFIVLTD